jgi:opacity protein-like surface antigen
MSMVVAIPVHAEEIFEPGVVEWSFNLGYGKNFETSFKGGNVKEDIQFFSFLFSRGKVFTHLTEKTTLGYALEGILSYALQEREDRYIVGLTPLLNCNFNNDTSFMPYIEVGLGVVLTNLDPFRFGGTFGFTPQLGLGIRYAISTKSFFKISYRFHHISNADLKEANRSIDSNFLFIGYSFLL